MLFVLSVKWKKYLQRCEICDTFWTSMVMMVLSEDQGTVRLNHTQCFIKQDHHSPHEGENEGCCRGQ